MRSVLVVDDDEAIRESLREVLEDEGYEARTAANGLEALEALRGTELSRPTLMLLDLMMPVMNGWQVLEAISHDPELRRIPVILVTAAGDITIPTSATVCIPKPIDLERLLNVIERHFPRA